MSTRNNKATAVPSLSSNRKDAKQSRENAVRNVTILNDRLKGPITNKKTKVEVVMEPSIHCQAMNHEEGKEHQRCSSQLSQLPIERRSQLVQPPSLLSRYTCVGILVAICSIWGKYVFINEDDIPNGQTILIHNGVIPFTLTALYVISLPMLHVVLKYYDVHSRVDVKLMLRESMILYNAIQVILNGYMVYRIVYALIWNGHPFIAGPIYLVNTGAAYAVWLHYCDKYLEFLDTYFMILRGKMDQVTFLHVYHHTSIACAWWIGLKLHPGGDIYFGALINSWIHVMMYSYYTLSLLKIRCPWKKYLTMAQLTQFVSVLLYSAFSMYNMPKEGTWKHYLGHSIQDFEMSSLFVLFMHFYRKAYSKKQRIDAAAAAAASLALQKTSADSDATSDTLAEEQESISSDSSDE